MEAMEKAGKPLRSGDIAKITGLESKEASRIIESLRKRGNVISQKTMLLFASEINIL